LLACSPGVDTELRAGAAANQEVTVAPVGDHAAVSRIVCNRVADVRPFDVPVVMQKGAPDLETCRARHLDVADEPVARQVDVVGELYGHPQPDVLQRDVGDERIFDVAELPIPATAVEPRELAVDEETGVADVAHRL